MSDGYTDPDFWVKYREYLEEVREVHSYPLSLFRTVCERAGYEEYGPRPQVLELGCGHGKEFQSWATCYFRCNYQAVDLTVEEPDRDAALEAWRRRHSHDVHEIMCADYRDPNLVHHSAIHPPNILVSLFSSEITGSPWANRDLYQNLFQHFPVRIALVSGFYYKNRVRENPLEEAGGLESWQTTFGSGEYDGYNFRETMRIELPVPSKLFGPDVVEVWRILEGKE